MYIKMEYKKNFDYHENYKLGASLYYEVQNHIYVSFSISYLNHIDCS